MKVLVTGGSGRVGGYVLRELQAHGHALLNYGRTLPLVEGFAHTSGDITDLAGLREALHQHEAVVHLAGVAHPRRATPEHLMQANLMGTFNVLEAAVREGVSKVVFASTDAALGFAFQVHPRQPSYLPIDEQHPCAPEDEYGLSKLLGEAMCRRYSAAYGLATICVRINSAWNLDRAGAEVSARFGATRSLPGTVDDIWALYQKQLEFPEGPLPVPGPPLPRVRLWGYTDARDTAQAIRLALENQGVTHDVFLTSADDTCSLEETSVLISCYFAGVPVYSSLAGYTSLFSHAKATRVLGYRPQYSWRNSDFSAWLFGRRAAQP